MINIQELTSVAAIIGVVNGLRLLENPDKTSFYYFSVAVILGLFFGGFKLFGVTGIEQGLLIGLASSGFYKVASKIGGY